MMELLNNMNQLVEGLNSEELKKEYESLEGEKYFNRVLNNIEESEEKTIALLVNTAEKNCIGSIVINNKYKNKIINGLYAGANNQHESYLIAYKLSKTLNIPLININGLDLFDEQEQIIKEFEKMTRTTYKEVKEKYQKQINDYGVNAEQQAVQGLSNSGYSESSKVSMYNTYQNRIATARDSFNRSILNYDNGIKDAQLQNNSALAEIAYNALKSQLELGLQGFQYKNSLLESQLNAQQTIEQTYQSKWDSILDQMNKDREFAESVRQFNENLAFQKQQEANEQARWNKEYSAKYGSGSGSYELTDTSTDKQLTRSQKKRKKTATAVGALMAALTK